MKCYEVLDIRPGSTAETVRKAYVELAHVWDPSQHLDNLPLRRLAEEKRKEIDAAYDALQSFLPDLSRGTPALAIDPVRPAGAIGDEVSAKAATETSLKLYAFFTFLVIAAMVSASFLGWRLIRRMPTVSPAVTTEQ